MNQHQSEILARKRFEFGANWARFLNVLNNERIGMAEESLRRMLNVSDLQGKHFLDIGSGSGLFSLAARRLGAIVHSFDYDPQSVTCTVELRRRYFPNDDSWVVEEGSVLDEKYLKNLGKFDIVYSWGVLHHTGQMWRALENVAPMVATGGKLFIAIYNDQGGQSKRWEKIKQIYNWLPKFLRLPFTVIVMCPRELKFLITAILRGALKKYINDIVDYDKKSTRGMSYWHDIVDWIGGYPFEVAKPEEIFLFFKNRGFILENIKTFAGGLACNEFVFTKA